MRNTSTFFTYLFNDFETEAEKFELDAETEELLMSLDIENFSPRESTVNRILNFARSYEIIKTKNAGVVEMNLN
jgi:hypothetical protein